MLDITHIFFDVGYTLVNKDAVWDRRCREQAKTSECRTLGLSAKDIYNAIVTASLSHKPQYRTLLEHSQLTEVAPYRVKELPLRDLFWFVHYSVGSALDAICLPPAK